MIAHIDRIGIKAMVSPRCQILSYRIITINVYQVGKRANTGIITRAVIQLTAFKVL